MTVLFLVLAYLLGSIPTGYIFGKVLKGIDIRKYGSGNVGATNVFRTVGKIPGVIVLVIDFLKGMVAVTLLPDLMEGLSGGVEGVAPHVYILLGACVIVGHIWTVFLKFRGGKGVATTAGVMASLVPLVLLGSLIVWIVVFAFTRYVSLASIIASVFLPIFAIIAGKDISFVIFCSILCLVGVYKHKENIKRLIHGTEKKLIGKQK